MKKIDYGNGVIEYDELAPCILCDEPVHNASMGGTIICPSCDLGKCRFCNERMTVWKEKIDGGKSKKQFLEHLRKHREELGLSKVYTEGEFFEAVNRKQLKKLNDAPKEKIE